MTLTRRAALSRAFAVSAGACAFLAAKGTRAATPIRFSSNPFKLGVASGDPSADGFVAWTRLAPNPFEPDGGLGDQAIEVNWEIASDPGFRQILRAGTEVAHPERGHSVRAELYGLASDRPYWYRFEAGGVRSPVGRAITLPPPGARSDRLKLAWASCQHYEHGWFTAYRDMVAWNPDLILHLGDYIYEASYGNNVRRHPRPDPRTLEDYRVHHAAYKLDPDLQAAHAHTSWAFMWDDHEVENDYASLVPQNPADAEIFPARRAAGYQAYFENLPLSNRSIVQQGRLRLYQQLIWGDLAQFLMLDARQYRSPRACVNPQRFRSGVVSCPELDDPNRTMLGADQEFFLNTALDEGPTRWSTIVQFTLFSDLDQKTPDGQPGGFQDSWDGYPAARQRLIDRIARRRNRDVVVIGGDMHAFWASDVKANFADPSSPAVASEFVGTSITSRSNHYERFMRIIREGNNGHIKFFDDRKRGWTAAVITKDAWNVDFRIVDSVWTRDPTFSTLNRWAVQWGEAGVKPA